MKLQDVLDEIIRKTSSGYEVVSSKKNSNGKRRKLSKQNLTKAQAETRLRQIEYFKNNPVA